MPSPPDPRGDPLLLNPALHQSRELSSGELTSLASDQLAASSGGHPIVSSAHPLGPIVPPHPGFVPPHPATFGPSDPEAAALHGHQVGVWDVPASYDPLNWLPIHAVHEAGPSHTSMAPPKGRKQQKKPQRARASCDGCRRRRTRCDRILPCSECLKRQMLCQYKEATQLPVLALNREVNRAQDREDYISRLEHRIRQLEEAAASPGVGLLQTPILQSSVLSRPLSEEDLKPRAPPAAAGSPSSPASPTSSPASPDALVDLNVAELAADLCSLSLGPAFRAHRARGPFAADLRRIAAEAKAGPSELERAFAHDASSLLSPTDPSLQIEFTSPEGPQTVEDILAIVPTLEQVEWCMSARLAALAAYGNMDSHDFPTLVHDFYASGGRLPPASDDDSFDDAASEREEGLQKVATILAFCTYTLFIQASSSLSVPGLGTITVGEARTLAGAWLRACVRALTLGATFDRPTVHGVRALAVLGFLPLHAYALKNTMFAWSTAAYLAGEIGLHDEPPVTADEAAAAERGEGPDKQEIESRRRLMWSVLGLEWAAGACCHKTWQLLDVHSFRCNVPGSDPATTELGPDGWPIDLSTAGARARAGWYRLCHLVTTTVARGELRYADFIKLERIVDRYDDTLPAWLRLRLEPDGLGWNPDDAYARLEVMLTRLPVIVRMQRLIVLGGMALPPADAERRLHKLLTSLRMACFMFLEMWCYMFDRTLPAFVCLDILCTFCAVLLRCDLQDPLLEPDASLDLLRKVWNLLVSIPDESFRAGNASIAALLSKCEARIAESSAPPGTKRSKGSPSEAGSKSSRTSSQQTLDGYGGLEHKSPSPGSPGQSQSAHSPSPSASGSRPTLPLPRPYNVTPAFTFRAEPALDAARPR